VCLIISPPTSYPTPILLGGTGLGKERSREQEALAPPPPGTPRACGDREHRDSREPSESSVVATRRTGDVGEFRYAADGSRSRLLSSLHVVMGKVFASRLGVKPDNAFAPRWPADDARKEVGRQAWLHNDYLAGRDLAPENESSSNVSRQGFWTRERGKVTGGYWIVKNSWG
jgi:hypothetical protein